MKFRQIHPRRRWDLVIDDEPERVEIGNQTLADCMSIAQEFARNGRPVPRFEVVG